MNVPDQSSLATPLPTAFSGDSLEIQRVRRLGAVAVAFFAAFGFPLWKIGLLSLHNELYSFAPLVPIISAYFIWVEKNQLFPTSSPTRPVWGFLLLLAAVGFAAWAAAEAVAAGELNQDALAFSVYSLVSALLGTACLIVGRRTFAVLGFPMAFLVFMAPLPISVESGFETMLQHGSSFVAHTFFDIAKMPVLREGTYFQLPGFSMQVAPECSGIRSTFALFLTSLVAGQLFLRSPWKRAFLAFVVLPIALLRNGLRVFVIGELCVQISHDMINSWIHRRGGPFFFALSLIPFVIILYYLYRSERRPQSPSASPLPH